MVFKRNTLRNTRTFKQSTSINTSNINTGSHLNQSRETTPGGKIIETVIKSKTGFRVSSPDNGHASLSPSKIESREGQPYQDGMKPYIPASDWKLKDLFPSFGIPEAHADRGDNIEKTSENDFKIDTDSESLGTYEELYNSPGGHRENTNRYNEKSALATKSSQEILDAHSDTFLFTSTQQDNKIKPLGPMTQGAQAGATQPSGSTLGLIKDYVNNEERSSFYNLPSHVSQSAHQAALDKQSMYQFENSIQKSFTTMIRDSGPDNRFNQKNFDALKTKINQSNISDKNKKNLISEYTNKITNYQKAAGGYGTDTPWAFGTSAPKNPNKAEKLKKKIESGEQVSDKEMKQFSILTQTPLGSNLKKDQNFGGYEQFL